MLNRYKLMLYLGITLLLISIVPLIISTNINKTSITGKSYSYHGIGSTHSLYVYLYGNDTFKLSINVAPPNVSGLLNISIVHVTGSSKYTISIPFNNSRIPVVKFTAGEPGVYKVTIQFIDVKNSSNLGVDVLAESVSGNRDGYRLYYMFLSSLISLIGLSSLAIYLVLSVMRR